MRKQDRVAAQHQDSRDQTHDTRQPDRPQPERVKGSASICGTDGYIEIAWPWKPTSGKGGYVLAHSTPPRQDQKNATAPPAPPRQSVQIDADQDLYALEADDFAATVLDGKAPAISRADTIGNMRVLDEIRRQIGLSF